MKKYLSRLATFTFMPGNYPHCMELVNILSQEEFINFYKFIQLEAVKNWMDYSNNSRSNEFKLNYDEVYREISSSYIRYRTI